MWLTRLRRHCALSPLLLLLLLLLTLLCLSGGPSSGLAHACVWIPDTSSCTHACGGGMRKTSHTCSCGDDQDCLAAVGEAPAVSWEECNTQPCEYCRKLIFPITPSWVLFASTLSTSTFTLVLEGTETPPSLRDVAGRESLAVDISYLNEERSLVIRRSPAQPAVWEVVSVVSRAVIARTTSSSLLAHDAVWAFYKVAIGSFVSAASAKPQCIDCTASATANALYFMAQDTRCQAIRIPCIETGEIETAQPTTAADRVCTAPDEYCTSNCVACDVNNTPHCMLCAHGTYMLDGVCMSACPAPFVTDERTRACRLCEPKNFALVIGTNQIPFCTPCDNPTCYTCGANDECVCDIGEDIIAGECKYTAPVVTIAVRHTEDQLQLSTLKATLERLLSITVRLEVVEQASSSSNRRRRTNNNNNNNGTSAISASATLAQTRLTISGCSLVTRLCLTKRLLQQELQGATVTKAIEDATGGAFAFVGDGSAAPVTTAQPPTTASQTTTAGLSSQQIVLIASGLVLLLACSIGIYCAWTGCRSTPKKRHARSHGRRAANAREKGKRAHKQGKGLRPDSFEAESEGEWDDDGCALWMAENGDFARPTSSSHDDASKHRRSKKPSRHRHRNSADGMVTQTTQGPHVGVSPARHDHADTAFDKNGAQQSAQAKKSRRSKFGKQPPLTGVVSIVEDSEGIINRFKQEHQRQKQMRQNESQRNNNKRAMKADLASADLSEVDRGFVGVSGERGAHGLPCNNHIPARMYDNVEESDDDATSSSSSSSSGASREDAPVSAQRSHVGAEKKNKRKQKGRQGRLAEESTRSQARSHANGADQSWKRPPAVKPSSQHLQAQDHRQQQAAKLGQRKSSRKKSNDNALHINDDEDDSVYPLAERDSDSDDLQQQRERRRQEEREKQRQREQKRRQILAWYKDTQFVRGVGIAKGDRPYNWYLGMVPTAFSERLLLNRPTGAFHIRVATRFRGFVLSVVHRRRTKHFGIRATQGNKYYIVIPGFNTSRHKTLKRLVKYYMTRPIQGACELKYPVGDRGASYKELEQKVRHLTETSLQSMYERILGIDPEEKRLHDAQYKTRDEIMSTRTKIIYQTMSELGFNQHEEDTECESVADIDEPSKFSDTSDIDDDDDDDDEALKEGEHMFVGDATTEDSAENTKLSTDSNNGSSSTTSDSSNSENRSHHQQDTNAPAQDVVQDEEEGSPKQAIAEYHKLLLSRVPSYAHQPGERKQQALASAPSNGNSNRSSVSIFYTRENEMHIYERADNILQHKPVEYDNLPSSPKIPSPSSLSSSPPPHHRFADRKPTHLRVDTGSNSNSNSNSNSDSDNDSRLLRTTGETVPPPPAVPPPDTLPSLHSPSSSVHSQRLLELLSHQPHQQQKQQQKKISHVPKSATTTAQVAITAPPPPLPRSTSHPQLPSSAKSVQPNASIGQSPDSIMTSPKIYNNLLYASSNCSSENGNADEGGALTEDILRERARLLAAAFHAQQRSNTHEHSENDGQGKGMEQEQGPKLAPRRRISNRHTSPAHTPGAIDATKVRTKSPVQSENKQNLKMKKRTRALRRRGTFALPAGVANVSSTSDRDQNQDSIRIDDDDEDDLVGTGVPSSRGSVNMDGNIVDRYLRAEERLRQRAEQTRRTIPINKKPSETPSSTPTDPRSPKQGHPGALVGSQRRASKASTATSLPRLDESAELAAVPSKESSPRSAGKSESLTTCRLSTLPRGPIAHSTRSSSVKSNEHTPDPDATVPKN